MNELAIELISQHIPSITDDIEDELDTRRFDTRVGRLGEPVTDTADLALRICHCGARIDGFYDYVDHLKEVLK